MLPGIDGFEVCRRLKSVEATANVPVIFISASDQTESLVDGFRAGGADYITKPFHPEEVLARVQTHLQISRLTRQIIVKNGELQQQAAELTASNRKLRDEIARREMAEDKLQTRTRSCRRSTIGRPSTGTWRDLSERAGRFIASWTTSGSSEILVR